MTHSCDDGCEDRGQESRGGTGGALLTLGAAEMGCGGIWIWLESGGICSGRFSITYIIVVIK